VEGLSCPLALGKPAGFTDRDSMMDFICDDFVRLFVKESSPFPVLRSVWRLPTADVRVRAWSRRMKSVLYS
jgi:hypothetical protein